MFNKEKGNIIGQALKRRRLELGLRQSDLAKMVGVLQQTVDKVENGVIKNPRNLKSYAEALGVKIDFFYSESYLQGSPSSVYSGGEISAVASAGFIPVFKLQHLLLPDERRNAMLQSLEKIPVYTKEDLSLTAVVMDSKSMEGEGGFSIEEGAILMFDPTDNPTNNCIVVVWFKAQGIVCVRQYINEGSTRLLKPLNKDFLPDAITNDAKILGVVKQKIVRY